jgi:hypothetical protein
MISWFQSLLFQTGQLVPLRSGRMKTILRYYRTRYDTVVAFKPTVGRCRLNQ